MIWKRIILPESMFDNASDADKAMILSLWVDGYECTALIGLDADNAEEGNRNYTLPRNTYLDIEGTVAASTTENIRLYIEASSWDEKVVNGDILNRTLNVSATVVTFTDPASARVYFWSNQPKVFVEEEGYVDGGTTKFPVDGFFENLSGVDADNITYDDAAKSTGYFDLKILASQSHGTYKRRIILNAGELRREITINATKPLPNYPAYKDILGIDKNGKMNLDGEGDMLYFKFGSVIGFVCQDKTVNDAWDNKYIVYNPSALKVGTTADGSTITGYGSNEQSLPAIPCYNQSHYDKNYNNISDNTYHNLANIKKGLGDPCRLIGMTISEIQNMENNSELYARENALKATNGGGWRLPTGNTMEDFEATSNFNIGVKRGNVAYTDYIPDGKTVATSGHVYFGIFTLFDAAAKTWSRNPEDMIYVLQLPATGYRNEFGVIIDQGFAGMYWTSEVWTQTYAFNVRFIPERINSYLGYYAYGASVRCVRQ